MTTEQQYEIDERAAIMEFDGGLSREEAERKARLPGASTTEQQVSSPAASNNQGEK